MKLAIINIGETLLSNVDPSHKVSVEKQVKLVSTLFLEALQTEQQKVDEDIISKFEKAVESALLHHKETKHTQKAHHGKHHLHCVMASVACNQHIFGLNPDKLEEIEHFAHEFLDKRKDLIYHHYKIVPYAIDIIKELKEEFGLKVIACTNARNYAKHLKILTDSGIDISSLFDDVITPIDNLYMPNPLFLEPTLKKYGVFDTPWLSMIVGDQVDKCLSCGHLNGMRTVYLSNVANHRHANCHALALGQHARPDFSILDFRQLRYTLEVMNKDIAECIIPNQPAFIRDYRIKDKIFGMLPSQKRIKVGLLIDGDAKLQIEVFWKTGLMRDDQNFAFFAFNIDEPFHQAWDHSNIDIVVQKFQDLLPTHATEETQEKLWQLKQWCFKNNLPIIDAPEQSLILQNRLLFLRNLKAAIAHMQQKHPENALYQRFRTSKFFDLFLEQIFDEQGLEKQVENVRKMMVEHDLAYPYVIKVLTASRNKYAHSFYVVRSDAGLKVALKFQGFQNTHLIFQEWIQHHEQLYKQYCIGPKHHDYIIMTSVPQQLIDKTEAFFFETKMKFQAADYTKFDPNEDRMTHEVRQVVAEQICVGYFGLNLVGVDMLFEENTGNIYLIDVNYFSSYKGLAHLDVEAAFKELIAEKCANHRLQHPVSEMEEYKKQHQYK